MDGAQEQNVREQIFNFLHLSNDMYRNQDDANFSDQGGQILYVFDATVFNLFFDTVQWRHAVSSFYSAAWSKKAPSQQWARIEAQSALIASEHLLSENLPGAKNRIIYLTAWHRLELATTLQKLVEEFRTGQLSIATITREMNRKVDLLRHHHGRTGRPANALGDSEELKRDLRELKPYLKSDAALERYELARRAASVLVRCELSERLDQIHRLVSKPLCNRLRGLHSLFPPSEQERQELITDAKQWYGRIIRETNQKWHVGKRPRSEEALWNDARSISFVRWAAKRARPDQRVVFVTSDDTIFDAYRRWWVNVGGVSGEPEEQFFMRRSFQFTPIFNLSDSKNDISQSEILRSDIQKLFSRIREAVEVSLLPFNLSSMQRQLSGNTVYSQIRGREFLALRGRDGQTKKEDVAIDYFMQSLDRDWFTRHSEALEDIAALWREIERIGIGFFYDKIIKRLEDDRYLFARDSDLAAGVSHADGMVEYLTKSLDALTSKTRAAWLPAAQAFLSKQEYLDSLGPGRAPETLWYRLADGRKIYDVIEHLDSINLKELEGAPEAAFVLASALAIRRSEWWKAEEFADCALAAGRDYSEADDVYWEIRFLAALTKRFRLGGVGLHLEGGSGPGRAPAGAASRKRVQEIYQQARRMIDECVDYFAKSRKTESNLLSLVRSQSERAALSLFFSASLLLTNEGVPLGSEEYSPAELVKSAQEDIFACIRWDELTSNRRHAGEHRAVRKQYLHNAAASEVVRFLMAPRPEFEIDARIGYVLEHLKQEDFSDSERLNPLMRVERIAFSILAGSGSLVLWSIFEDAAAAGMRSDLAIDRALCRAIYAKRDVLFRILARQV